MSDVPACPHCGGAHAYEDRGLLVCPECGHEWSPGGGDTAGPVVRDSNGNPLVAGDAVVVIKDLKVKGSSVVLKQGTLIRNIRLAEDDPEHVEGHTDRIKDLVVKTQFLRKA